MKKSILFLTAFMLLGLSFAKAQQVTIYDMEFKNEVRTSDSMDFYLIKPDKNISISVNIKEIRTGKGGSRKVARATVTLGTSGDLWFQQSARSERPEDGLWTAKAGNRTHLVRIDSGKKKYVYAFFDDCNKCPNPMDEFNKKLRERGL